MLREVNTGPAAVQLVADEAYLPALKALVRGARERVWCSLFIVDLAPSGDPGLLVDGVLRDLATARWRGVDTRLLIGGSRDTLLIAEASAGALRAAREMGIPTRGLSGQTMRGSHIKLVVADDWVLTGSHNWSAGAFSGQAQDSVLAQSGALSAYLCGLFLTQWRRAKRAPQE